MDFKIYPLQKHAVAVYMNSAVFFEQDEIESRVDEIYGECFNEVGISYFGKESVLILYVNMKNEDNKKKLLSLNRNDTLKSLNLSAKNILGLLRVELYKNYAEIYDVCTGYDFRRRGIMHALFQNMFQVLKKKSFWLGVQFDNPTRDAAIRFYLKEGFHFQNVTFITPSNVRLKFPVLSFVKGGEQINRNMFSALSDIACNFSFKLRWADMINIQNNVYSKNAETGGTMDIVNGFLIPNLNSVIYGDPKTLTIETPVHYLNWHSHPDICYEKNNCYIGWPSGQDMKSLFHNYNFGVIFHLLFTSEGLYTMKLTINAMKMIYILSFNVEYLIAIEQVIFERFTYVEKYRACEGANCMFSSSSVVKRNENIKEFLRKANTATLKDYNVQKNSAVESSIKYFEQFYSSLFPLFEVTFYDKSYIGKRPFELIRLNTIRAPIKNFCPF